MKQGNKKCAEWLVYCLSIGWKKSDLDGLQKIWHKFKDENGNLKTFGNDYLLGTNKEGVAE